MFVQHNPPKKTFPTRLVGVPVDVWPVLQDIQKALSGTSKSSPQVIF